MAQLSLSIDDIEQMRRTIKTQAEEIARQKMVIESQRTELLKKEREMTQLHLNYVTIDLDNRRLKDKVREENQQWKTVV